MNTFDKIVQWLDSGEHSFVTLLSKIIPLLVPLIPAYVGYAHVTRELGFSQFFGFTYGMVIEGLGYASIFKAVQFWENNRHYSKKENQAPLLLAVVIYLVYIIVTLSVNVLLDWASGVLWWKVFATGAISLLSIPAGLLMSISAVHTERVNMREQAKNERKENKERTTNEQPVRQRTHRTNTLNERSLDGSLAVRQKIGEFVQGVQANEHRTPGPSEISRTLGVSKGYASETLQILLKEQTQEERIQ